MPPCDVAGDVLATLPLHEQEIQPIRVTNAEYRQNRVRLATMMCLVIEHMRKNLSAALLLRSAIQRPIGPRLFHLRVGEACRRRR